MKSGRTTNRGLIVAGVHPVLELLRSGAAVDRVLVGPGPRRGEVLEACSRRGVKPLEADRQTLDRLADRLGHQGAVAISPGFHYAELGQLGGAEERLTLVLDGIQDPRNLGAILRTARAAGVAGVVLPQNRSVGITPVVVAASAGTLFGLPVIRVPNLVRAMQALKDLGFWLAGLLTDGSASLYELDAPERIALVVGGEGGGVRHLVRRTCDFEVRIPMAPGIESLNVSVATGIALFELRRRAGQVR
jgi:23S rRNA (guanosine2251-2'-O)-methyltransferase